MRKVRDEGKRPALFQQLPLFDETRDPVCGEPPPFTEDPAGRITPEKAHAILKEHGLDVSLEQAAEILSFLRKLVSISLSQIIKK